MAGWIVSRFVITIDHLYIFQVGIKSKNLLSHSATKFRPFISTGCIQIPVFPTIITDEGRLSGKFIQLVLLHWNDATTWRSRVT